MQGLDQALGQVLSSPSPNAVLGHQTLAFTYIFIAKAPVTTPALYQELPVTFCLHRKSQGLPSPHDKKKGSGKKEPGVIFLRTNRIFFLLGKQQQKPGSRPPSAPPTPKTRARYPDPAWEGNLLSPYVHEQTVLCHFFFFPLLFFVLKRHWLLYREGPEDFPVLGAVPDSLFSALTQHWEGSIAFNP